MIALFQTHASAHKETGELCEVRDRKKKRNKDLPKMWNETRKNGFTKFYDPYIFVLITP